MGRDGENTVAMLDTRLGRENGKIIGALMDVEDILVGGVDPDELPALRAAVERAWDGALGVEGVKVDQRICRFIETHGWTGGVLNAPLSREIVDLARVRLQRKAAGAGAPGPTSQPTATARG